MTFLITGASRGIGFELAMFALEAGHKVLAVMRSPDAARSLNTAKKEHGDRLIFLKADVSKPEDIVTLGREVGDQTIDVLINNAGVFTDNDENFKKLTFEELQQAFAINTFAPAIITQTFLENLKKSNAAKLVTITSLMGSIEDNQSGGYYAYRMSKVALNMFVRSFSFDFPQVVALTMHPGWVRTEMGGPQAPVLPRESARGLFKFITEATEKNSGHFYDYAGKELPW